MNFIVTVMKYMRITDVLFIFMMAISYLAVNSEIRDAQIFGFYGFIGSFVLWLCNVLFRHGLKSYKELKEQENEKAAFERRKLEMMLAQQKAIKEFENSEMKSNRRTTARIQERKRAAISRTV